MQDKKAKEYKPKKGVFATKRAKASIAYGESGAMNIAPGLPHPGNKKANKALDRESFDSFLKSGKLGISQEDWQKAKGTAAMKHRGNQSIVERKIGGNMNQKKTPLPKFTNESAVAAKAVIPQYPFKKKAPASKKKAMK